MAIQVDLTINVPTQAEVNDFVAYHGYTATVPDLQDPTKTIANPVTKGDFAKGKIIDFVRDSITAHRANTAGEVARKASIETVKSLVID